MAKSEIVTQRVVSVQPAKAARDVQSHRPAGAFHLGQTDIRRDARDVRIQWNDELARSHSRPDSAIDSVRRTSHPAQIEIQALAGASLRRPRKEEPHSN